MPESRVLYNKVARSGDYLYPSRAVGCAAAKCQNSFALANGFAVEAIVAGEILDRLLLFGWLLSQRDPIELLCEMRQPQVYKHQVCDHCGGRFAQRANDMPPASPSSRSMARHSMTSCSARQRFFKRNRNGSDGAHRQIACTTCWRWSGGCMRFHRAIAAGFIIA